MSATKARSGLKALTWRIIATLDTFLIALLITGDAIIASTIISIEVVTKFGLYYVHERLWTTQTWGLTNDHN